MLISYSIESQTENLHLQHSYENVLIKSNFLGVKCAVSLVAAYAQQDQVEIHSA